LVADENLETQEEKSREAPPYDPRNPLELMLKRYTNDFMSRIPQYLVLEFRGSPEEIIAVAGFVAEMKKHAK